MYAFLGLPPPPGSKVGTFSSCTRWNSFSYCLFSVKGPNYVSSIGVFLMSGTQCDCWKFSVAIFFFFIKMSATTNMYDKVSNLS